MRTWTAGIGLLVVTLALGGCKGGPGEEKAAVTVAEDLLRAATGAKASEFEELGAKLGTSPEARAAARTHLQEGSSAVATAVAEHTTGRSEPEGAEIVKFACKFKDVPELADPTVSKERREEILRGLHEEGDLGKVDETLALAEQFHHLGDQDAAQKLEIGFTCLRYG
jgi:hypothetical protein